MSTNAFRNPMKNISRQDVSWLFFGLDMLLVEQYLFSELPHVKSPDFSKHVELKDLRMFIQRKCSRTVNAFFSRK